MSEKEIFKRMPGLVKAGEGEEIPIETPELGCLTTFNRKVGAIYFEQVKDAKKNTVATEKVNENCNVDLDKFGDIVGIEILDAKRWIKQHLDKIING